MVIHSPDAPCRRSRHRAAALRWLAPALCGWLVLLGSGCQSPPRWREALDVGAPAKRFAQLLDADRLGSLLGGEGFDLRPIWSRHRDDWANVAAWPAEVVTLARNAGQALGEGVHAPALAPALRDFNELLRESPDDFRVRTGPTDMSDADRAVDPTQPLPNPRPLIWRILDRLR